MDLTKPPSGPDSSSSLDQPAPPADGVTIAASALLRPIGAIFAVLAMALVPLGCGSDEEVVGSSGTLPPIKTTTTLAASQTTAQPYFLHYRLKSGETLAVVAKAFNIPVTVLIDFNKETLGENPNKVGVGTEVVIPPQRYIDTLETTPTTEPE